MAVVATYFLVRRAQETFIFLRSSFPVCHLRLTWSCSPAWVAICKVEAGCSSYKYDGDVDHSGSKGHF